MIGKKLVSSENVPLYEVKNLLSERNKDSELTYEQQQAFDYSKKFSKIPPSKGEKLMKDLKAIEGLDDDFIVKAIDILPQDIETARLILPGKGASISDDILNKVVELTSKYAK